MNRTPVPWKRCSRCGRGYAGRDGLDPACRAMLSQSPEERVEVAQARQIRRKAWRRGFGFPRNNGCARGTP